MEGRLPGEVDVPGSSSRGVFLSYRREDAAPYARLLQSELRQRFPAARIFMDLETTEAGRDFVEFARETVDSCAVMVALIGRQWTTLTDEDGVRRLDNPDDYVRFEVQTALEHGVRVIPVLVDGAGLLQQDQLPSELQKLARLNALELSYGRYQDDADRLLNLIQPLLAEMPYVGTVDQGIFLSYRQQDTTPYARLLQFQLTERLPNARLFMDVDAIAPGMDFVEVIQEAVASCTVMVALIGRQWAAADAEGRRRLDDPFDFVRMELQTALEQGVRVIPVLVDGAKHPQEQQLPPELQKLARLNALELSASRYEYDADRLFDLIQRVLAAAPSASTVDKTLSAAKAKSSLGERSADTEIETTLLTLDGRQFRLMHDVLVSSYDHEGLARDLQFELEKSLPEISGPDSFSNVVFRVLKAAEWGGWLLKLLRMFQDRGTSAVSDTATRILTELGPSEYSEVKKENPAPSRCVKVFLCHSSSDKNSVRALRAKLLDDGMQPWFDEEDILPGQDWDFAISNAIRTSDMVLVCLSAASISKVGYLQKEIRSVLDLADAQPEGSIFLIPVRLEPCDVPERLSRWQWVDLFAENGYTRLMRSLRSRNFD